MLLAWATCATPWTTVGRTYSGTVVDARTDEPIEGAVVAVRWVRCGFHEWEGCGIPHGYREAVTGASGVFSMSATPDFDWNPFTYIADRAYIVVYAVGYAPLAAGTATRAEFGGDLAEFRDLMFRNPRIPLHRLSPLEVGADRTAFERLARPPYFYAFKDLGARNLLRAVAEQERKLQSVRSESATK